MVSLIKRTYRRILPLTVRTRLWDLRASLRQPAAEVRDSRRDLSFLRTRGCAICGERNLERFSGPERMSPHFRFYQCRDCEYIFVFPAPDTSANAYYEASTTPDFGAGERIWNDH